MESQIFTPRLIKILNPRSQAMDFCVLHSAG